MRSIHDIKIRLEVMRGMSKEVWDKETIVRLDAGMKTLEWVLGEVD